MKYYRISGMGIDGWEEGEHGKPIPILPPLSTDLHEQGSWSYTVGIWNFMAEKTYRSWVEGEEAGNLTKKGLRPLRFRSLPKKQLND